MWRMEMPKEPITVKIKLVDDFARLPTRGTPDAACFDLYASEEVILESKGPRKKVPTGIALEIPSGYCGRIYSRSSSFLKGLDIGSLVVDADYVGEIFIMAGYDDDRCECAESVINVINGRPVYVVKAGDRIAQIRIEKLVETKFELADKLKETQRGTGGYGSTGR